MKIEDFKDEDETILWKGKPNKYVFVTEKIFTPLAIFAIIWMLFDIGFLAFFFTTVLQEEEMKFMAFAIIPFMILHLMPVWLYLGGIIFSFKNWKNTNYMVTDKAVYATSGAFTVNCIRKTFQEITNVSFHQGLIDKNHNVGDVFISTGLTVSSNGKTKNAGINIIDIEDFLKVYKLINKTGTDIFSDTMYPNNLRPDTNDGYKTKYNNENE